MGVVTVAVAAAFAAMRTASFTHGAALSVTMGVRLTFAVVLPAVAVVRAMMMRVPIAMRLVMMMCMFFAMVLTTVAFSVAFAVAVLTFARVVRVGAMMPAFGVLMPLAVMRTVCLRRIVKRAGEVLCDSLVRRALDAGIDADAG